MRLELRIRGHLLDEVELTMPEKDYFMDDKSNYERRVKYIKYMSESLKIKYHRAIENSEYELILITESKVNRHAEIDKSSILNIIKELK